MHRAWILVLACAAALAQDRVLVDRVGSTGFLQLEAPSFEKLSPRQQRIAGPGGRPSDGFVAVPPDRLYTGMIWDPSRVCQHLVSQVDQHFGWVIIRSG